MHFRSCDLITPRWSKGSLTEQPIKHQQKLRVRITCTIFHGKAVLTGLLRLKLSPYHLVRNWTKLLVAMVNRYVFRKLDYYPSSSASS